MIWRALQGESTPKQREDSQGNTDGTLQKAYSISSGVTVMQNIAKRGENR